MILSAHNTLPARFRAMAVLLCLLLAGLPVALCAECPTETPDCCRLTHEAPSLANDCCMKDASTAAPANDHARTCDCLARGNTLPTANQTATAEAGSLPVPLRAVLDTLRPAMAPRSALRPAWLSAPRAIPRAFTGCYRL